MLLTGKRFRINRLGYPVAVGSAPSPLAVWKAAVAASLPLAHWCPADVSGATMPDPINGYDAALGAGVTAGEAGPVSYLESIYYPDTLNGVVNLYSVGLGAAFPYDAGSFFAYVKAADWVAGGHVVTFIRDANNKIELAQNATNDRMQAAFYIGAVYKVTTEANGQTSTDFRRLLITWDRVADEAKFFVDDVQVGSTLTGLGTWGGILSSNGYSLGGSAGTAGTWYGHIGDAILYDRAVLPADVPTPEA